MGKLNYQVAEELSGGGGNDFFTLKNDKDTAVVRFLYESEDELDIYAVHETELGGKKRYVECIGVGDDAERCPLCEAGNYRRVKMFLQLEENGTVKTWERGKKFIPKIIGLINKYGKDKNGKYVGGGFANREYEIERNGKAGSTDTTYELYPLDRSDVVYEDLPEKQVLLGTFVLQKTGEEMEEYLETGDFPKDANEPATKEPATRGRTSARKADDKPKRGRRPAPADDEEIF